VDDCETRPELASKVNAEGTHNVVRACRRWGIPILYLSTDYVFDGENPEPYVETDAPGGIDTGLRALDQNDPVMKADVWCAVQDFLCPVLTRKAITPLVVHSQWKQRIAAWSEIVALARADVPRTRGGREIIGCPQPEGNTRLAQELAQVGRGWAVLIGLAEVGEEEFALIKRAGLDSIPPIRKEVFMALVGGKSAYSLGLPESSVNRALEDLNAIGRTEGDRKSRQLSEKAQALLDECFPQRAEVEAFA
jgi:hypothetical protein